MPNHNQPLIFSRSSLSQALTEESLFYIGFALGMLTAGAAITFKNNHYRSIDRMPSSLMFFLHLLIGHEFADRYPLNMEFLKNNFSCRERQFLTAGVYSGSAMGTYLFVAHFAEVNNAAAAARQRNIPQ